MPRPPKVKTAALTMAALIAFAANSVLCRQALGGALIDAAGFSALRLASGAAMLLALSARMRRPLGQGGSWGASAALFAYVVAFSFAYLSLATGTGALLLFGTVQVTMILAGLRLGEKPGSMQWSGLALALSGLVILLFPGLSAPSPAGSVLMIVAGLAWGIYSLSGRGGGDPMTVTAANFVRCLPFVLVLVLVSLPTLHITEKGAFLAVLSGALASGCGYLIWYAALPAMTATLAATVQLAVPILAAGGGILFLSEPITARFVVASLCILGGIALVVLYRFRHR